jgi:NAD(P)-dependent dehydrogenase (short-subunit alcohol dehydrogenase family)
MTDHPQTKLVLITGGSRGIGLALARTFANAGYQVIISGRNGVSLKEAADSLTAKSASGVASTIETLAFDIADPGAVDKAFQQLKQAHSTIDVLINNAGLAHALKPVDELSLGVWRQVIDINLTGTFLVTRAALSLMRDGGSIVNNLSVAAVQPFAGMAAYNASKFGAMGFTQALREDLRQRGIRVIALLPGATDTDIWQQFWPDAPRARMVSPDTVAEAVLHAVSAPANASIDEIRVMPAAGVL